MSERTQRVSYPARHGGSSEEEKGGDDERRGEEGQDEDSMGPTAELIRIS